MTIARHTHEEERLKLELLKKEQNSFKKDNRYYWLVLFIVCVFVGIIVFAVWHYFF